MLRLSRKCVSLIGKSFPIRQISSSTNKSTWSDRKRHISALVGIGATIGAVSWYSMSSDVKDQQSAIEISCQNALMKKIKAVEDHFLNYDKLSYRMSDKPKLLIDPSHEFAKTLLDLSRFSVIHIEGPCGIGKSTLIFEITKDEHEKGTPVAVVELRGLHFDDEHSVSNNIFYQLGLQSAVFDRLIDKMNILECTNIVEKALQEMMNDGKDTPILVIDNAEILFDRQSSDHHSSISFLQLLEFWSSKELIRPIVISSRGSISRHFTKYDMYTFELPEVPDEDLFKYLKSKLDPLRSMRNQIPWTDQEMQRMVEVYGANFIYLNQIAVTRDHPNVAIDDDIKTNELNIIQALQNCPNCIELIKKLVNEGHFQLSEGDDWEAIESLIDTDILTYVNGQYKFYSCIMKQAAKQIFQNK